MPTDNASLRTLTHETGYWLPLALLVLGDAQRYEWPMVDPVAMAQAVLARCRIEGTMRRQAAELQCSLDLVPAARLAFCRAWDRAIEMVKQ